MSILAVVLPPFAAGLLSFLLTPLAAHLAVRIGAMDLPGPRKIHDRAVPRLGGAVVIVSFATMLAVVLLLRDSDSLRDLALAIGLGALPVVAVSVRDDIFPVSARMKLAAHLAGAIVSASFGVSLGSEIHLFGTSVHLGWMAVPLSVIWMVSITNAFNLVDGLDGLSAGLGCIASVSLGFVFLMVGQTGTATASFVLAGAIAGFLPQNFYPARMFLGETGAATIGFCLAALSLRGGSTLSAGLATILPVFIFGMPIAEALVSIARRWVGSKGGIFDPDRNHIHHRLLALGIDHRRAVLTLYGGALVTTLAGLFSLFVTAQHTALLVTALACAAFVGVSRLDYDEFAFIRGGAALRLYEAPVLRHSFFYVFGDLLIVAASVYLAIALKADDWNLQRHRAQALTMLGVLAPSTVLSFHAFRLYRGEWKLASIDDFRRIVAAVVLTSLAGFMLSPLVGYASSVSLQLIYMVVALVLVVTSRAAYPILADRTAWASHTGAPTLIFGAGRGGAGAVRQLLADDSAHMRPVGFVDDDPRKVGRLVQGIPVLGCLRELERIVKESSAEAIVIAASAVSDERLRDVVRRCEALDIGLVRMEIRFEHMRQAPRRAEPTADVPEVPELPQAGAASSAGHVRRRLYACRCRSCGSTELRRSRLRHLLERFRSSVTHTFPYRCNRCGVRTWHPSLEPVAPLSFCSANPASLR